MCDRIDVKIAGVLLCTQDQNHMYTLKNIHAPPVIYDKQSLRKLLKLGHSRNPALVIPNLAWFRSLS